MPLSFIKMHGLGNDFVFLDGMESDFDIQPEQVVAMCNRHTGIGADGTVTVRPSADADCWMDYRNSDGTVAEMCGNAVRCVAKFMIDRGYATSHNIAVQTGAGIKQIEAVSINGATEYRVNMGSPELRREFIPMLGAASEQVVSEPIRMSDREARITAVQTGNPHAVEFVDNVETVPLHAWGPATESHPAFPNKTNAEFAQVLDRENIRMRVWERGCGETLACGTGAVATGVAGVLNELTEPRVNVLAPKSVPSLLSLIVSQSFFIV